MAGRRRRRYKKRKKERVSNIDRLNGKKSFLQILGKIISILIILALIAGVAYALYQGYTNVKQKGLLISSKRIVEPEYFSVYENEKWGVIDGEGNTLIEPKYKEMVLIPNSSKQVFIKTEFDESVSEDDIKEDSKYKTLAINDSDNVIFKKYSEVLPIEYNSKDLVFDQEMLIVKNSKGLYGLIDYDGTEKLELEYKKIETMPNIPEKLLVTKKDKKGVYNTKTKEFVVPVIYKNLSPISNDTDSSYEIVFDKLKGVISSTGKKVLETEYDSIEKLDTTKYIVAKKDDSRNIYNLEGEKVGDAPSDIRKISSLELIITGKDNKLELKDFKGKKVLDKTYEDIKIISKNTFIVKEDGKYNVIHFGKKKLEKNYDSIEYIEKADIYIATFKGEDDLYDVEFNKKMDGVIVSETDNEKYLLITDDSGDQKFYNFKFEEIPEKIAYSSNTLFRFKSEGKYGFKDSNDNVVVQAIYDDAKFQNKHGYISVNRDGKWGSLNYKGEIVVEPKYDFDDYIKIDFIGKYHIDKNPDLEVYTK